MNGARRPNRKILFAVDTVVRAIGALVLLIGSGCISHPQTSRPSIDQLVQESLNASLPRFEIEQTDPIEHAAHVQAMPDVEYGGTFSDAAPDWDADPMLAVDDYHREAFLALESPETAPLAPILFTEEFIETDVREVLLAIAQDAGIDLVMDEKVRGVVNTRLENLPLDRAIEKVLMPLGLHYAQHGDQHVVAPADPDSPLFSHISQRIEYRPKHLESKALISTVPANTTRFAQEIEGANLIIVEAPLRIATQIVERFASIDQPIPQVILEAIICVVSPDSGFQFGLDWQHAVELNGQNALKLGATGLALSSSYTRAGANAIFDDFAKTSSFVKLLSEHGYLTIRASPHVMAQDNQKASIAINRETFFSVQPPSTGNTDNSSFFFQQEIQTVESGITLDITPRIRGDIVTIDIEKAEVSEDVRNANTELALNPFPIINRRSVSTTVHVKDGKTIVIGGLVQRETIDRVNRIPGLSKIPLVGYLFQTTQRQTRDAEVVIFISPKIMMLTPSRD